MRVSIRLKAMNVPATSSFDTPGDAARAAELRRVKALATLVLAGTLTLFVTAKALLPLHPVFGFIAAFAGAATIGGLADWYAVVALFRRPLGLPIPHTAIIQSNQHRIADKLGEFIEVHFLEAGPVEAKLRQIDFGSFIADWLRDRKRSADLARFILRLLPEAVSATETSGLMDFITRRVTTQLQSIDLAPLAAGTLRAFVAEGRHRVLLDDILSAFDQSLVLVAELLESEFRGIPDDRDDQRDGEDAIPSRDCRFEVPRDRALQLAARLAGDAPQVRDAGARRGEPFGQRRPRDGPRPGGEQGGAHVGDLRAGCGFQSGCARHDRR